MTKNKNKQIRELEKDRDFYKTYFDDWGYWFIGCLILLVLVLALVLILNSKIRSMVDLEGQLESCQENVLGNLNSTFYFDNLNKNCGSSFVTKRYGDDKYFVFVNDCKEDGYCKSEYVPLGDCEVIE